MAMAGSGIDPLVRLQTGSKELRTERELLQVAAETGFSTESGAATSTVRLKLRPRPAVRLTLAL